MQDAQPEADVQAQQGVREEAEPPVLRAMGGGVEVVVQQLGRMVFHV